MLVSGVDVEVTRKTMRTIRMVLVAPYGQVRVSAPHHTSESTVRAFVCERVDWIRSKRAEMLARPVPPEQPPLDDAARRHLHEIADAMLKRWAAEIGVVYSSWRIKNMKTRWGS